MRFDRKIIDRQNAYSNRKRKLIKFAIFQKHLTTTRLTNCNDLTRFSFCSIKIPLPACELDQLHQIYSTLRFDRKNIDSLLKQEAEINQFCHFPETSDDDDEADDGEGMTEIRFAPDDKATLQVMFSSMSHCQTLHPDPEAAEDAADEEAENDEVRSILISGLELGI